MNTKFKELIENNEYLLSFDKGRKEKMVVSYYKYGPLIKNYGKDGTIQCIPSLIKRLDKYILTKNREFLEDVANFAMQEFMYPQNNKAFLSFDSQIDLKDYFVETGGDNHGELKTEYCEQFDLIRRYLFVQEFNNNRTNHLQEINKLINEYEQIGDQVILAKIANFAMQEYVHPQLEGVFYKATDSNESCGVVGMGINEVLRFDDDNIW